jgi:hypothetical protein
MGDPQRQSNGVLENSEHSAFAYDAVRVLNYIGLSKKMARRRGRAEVSMPVETSSNAIVSGGFLMKNVELRQKGFRLTKTCSDCEKKSRKPRQGNSDVVGAGHLSGGLALWIEGPYTILRPALAGFPGISPARQGVWPAALALM